ncbi:uncharacterized protein FA14DRAFT_160788 [Meira miltonrushii]|uniref:Uncharacterized protein n=1 Tax=Meira miltonrushii TaxID=1280837 RepID=A0A316VDR6_9BASI|nr:uncharacterized protein FA14DRAFT_160788 [Meira miltonrushii]PWN35779.1 hypothetical protein FA14DRAFT_160788 [Meira miltonrushii]
MVHHITKVEEVTFMVHEIAILKHPDILMTDAEWQRYRKLASSYIHHRSRVSLVVRRFDEWRNHSYDRDHENANALYNTNAGSERYEQGDFFVHQEVELQDGGDDDDGEGYEMLDDYERETIELQKEVANLEHPSARIELQLVWAQRIGGTQDQECTEAQITSPYVLKLNKFIAKNVTCMNAGGAAFKVEHTNREVELSFRHPLEGPEYNFRKVRIFFHENEEMQDFLSRIDVSRLVSQLENI